MTWEVNHYTRFKLIYLVFDSDLTLLSVYYKLNSEFILFRVISGHSVLMKHNEKTGVWMKAL